MFRFFRACVNFFRQRLTNGFSKKVENHAHSVALFALYYNFVSIRRCARRQPWPLA
jgi:hypothetical protein